MLGAALAPTPAGASGIEPRAEARSASFPPREVRAFKEIVRDGMSANRIPGVNVGIWAPGRGRFVHSFGVANRRSGRQMRTADHVRIASITKTFTGIATLRLVDQGRLRLSNKLSAFVRGVPNGPRITIRQLLGMTAGIYDFTKSKRFAARFKRNPSLPFPARDVIGILRRHGSDFRPGKKVSYSDSNYLLLGRVIKKVTGHSPARVIRHQVIDRLRLDETSYPTRESVPKPRARGYFAGDGGKGRFRDYTRINPLVPGPGGGMISTMHDLKVWARALATGRLLSKSTHARQLHFRRIPNPGPLSVGYGLGIFRIQGFVGHNGAIFGYNTSAFYLPRARATIVVEANKSTNFSEESLEIFVGLAKRIFPGEFQENVR